MGYKIAVASSDGKFVNQHFGQINQLYIYEVEDKNYKFIELRKVNIDNSEDHNKKFFSIVNYILDCKIVLVSQIGQKAVRFLAGNGITAFDIEESIDSAIKKLIKYYSRIDKINRYCN